MGTRLLVVAETYFMTRNVTVTFVVGLNQLMTPKGHRVIRGRCDLFVIGLTFLITPEDHGNICCLFDLVHDL